MQKVKKIVWQKVEAQRKLDQEGRNSDSEIDRLARLEAQTKIDRERRNAESAARLLTQRKVNQE